MAFGYQKKRALTDALRPLTFKKCYPLACFGSVTKEVGFKHQKFYSKKMGGVENFVKSCLQKALKVEADADILDDGFETAEPVLRKQMQDCLNKANKNFRENLRKCMWILSN